MSLVQDAKSQTVKMRTHRVNVVVEKLEILVLREVLKHLLEAQLHKEVSPGEVVRVVILNSGLLDSSDEVTMVLLGNVSSERVILVLKIDELFDFNAVIISNLSELLG